MNQTDVHNKPTERLAKYLARAGLCSRRTAETWILNGRISVDNQTVLTPLFFVSSSNAISLDNTPIRSPQPTRLWKYHKPRGLISTTKDPQGRPTIFDYLPKTLPYTISIGRLDLNSEGLLLLTNNGNLSRYLTLPQNKWVRSYRVRVHGKVSPHTLDKLSQGITLNNILYKPSSISLEKQQNSNTWLKISLQEGKNREIRKILQAFNLTVNRLIRTSFGPFHLGHLIPNTVVEIPAHKIEKLYSCSRNL